MTAGRLTVAGDTFLRDGEPHQVVSGAVHYFRVHPDLWRDRLERVRAMGLNTVETYVAWNLHERRRGEPDFTGQADLERFVVTAGELGLDVIVRPGPFICAEWDLGGLPAWLLAERGLRLRCLDPAWLGAVDAWFDVLVPRLVPLLSTHGGPVVAVQVENEYGSYGDDADYLEHCRKGMVDRGIDVLLVTSDGPGPDWLDNGMVPGVLATANFGSKPGEAFAALREAQPDGPKMCMEYWNGWFDHWGEEHHVRSAGEAAETLDEMLAAGASVNLYMAHGGTNHGLWSGANEVDGRLQPTVTSYDDDAPVGEAGELTPKFHAFREVISRYAAVPDGPLPAALPRQAPQTVAVSGWGGLLAQLDLFDPPVSGPHPLTMEQLGQDHGLVLYRGDALVPPGGADLVLEGLRDRAVVLADGARVGTVESASDGTGIRLEHPADGRRTGLEVLVENQGRVNFGPTVGERKGLTGVRLAHRYVHGWTSTAVRVDRPGLTQELRWAAERPCPGPVFALFEVEAEAGADGFLALPGWGKGLLWLNGTLLGRYWHVGPQVTLYAAAPLWRQGRNEVVVLELDTAGTVLELRDEPDLGAPRLA